MRPIDSINLKTKKKWPNMSVNTMYQLCGEDLPAVMQEAVELWGKAQQKGGE